MTPLYRRSPWAFASPCWRTSLYFTPRWAMQSQPKQDMWQSCYQCPSSARFASLLSMQPTAYLLSIRYPNYSAFSPLDSYLSIYPPIHWLNKYWVPCLGRGTHCDHKELRLGAGVPKFGSQLHHLLDARRWAHHSNLSECRRLHGSNGIMIQPGEQFWSACLQPVPRSSQMRMLRQADRRAHPSRKPRTLFLKLTPHC